MFSYLYICSRGILVRELITHNARPKVLVMWVALDMCVSRIWSCSFLSLCTSNAVLLSQLILTSFAEQSPLTVHPSLAHAILFPLRGGEMDLTHVGSSATDMHFFLLSFSSPCWDRNQAQITARLA